MDQTFSFFPRLPPELRLMIWEFCTPLQPRIIELRLTRHWTSPEEYEKHDFVAAIPSILHTCHDSRSIGLKTYKLSFGSSGAMRPMYFNPDIDNLFVRDRSIPFGYETQQAARVLRNLPNKHEIQRLTVTLFTAINYTYNKPPVLFHFPNLKEVTLVRLVQPNTLFPCHEPWLDAHDYYVLDKKLDTSSTPLGFTHFVTETELRSSSPKRVHMLSTKEFCLTCPKFTFSRQVSDNYELVKEKIDEFYDGSWGDMPWNKPRFGYCGVSYDRISLDQMSYKYRRYNLRSTTKRKALL